MRALLFALAAVMAAFTAGAGALNGVLHSPVSTATIGRPIELMVELDADGLEDYTVTAHYRGMSARNRKLIALELVFAADRAVYLGEIPRSATQQLGLRYYIEITNSDGALFRLGSAARPLAIELLEGPEYSAIGPPVSWGMLAGSLGGLFLLVGARRVVSRRSLRRLRDELFWAQTLAPLQSLHGRVLARTLLRVADLPLGHPDKGLTFFSYATLMRRMREMRQLDLAELRDRHRRLLPDETIPGVSLSAELLVDATEPEADTQFVGATSVDVVVATERRLVSNEGLAGD